MNKKGEVDIITMAFVIIGLLFLAPFILKIVMTPLDKFSQAMNTTAFAGTNSSAEVSNIRDNFVGWWDTLIIIAMVCNILLLFVSAYLIDVNPVFLIFYLLTGVFTLIFAPVIIDSLQETYNSSVFIEQVSNLTMTSFVLDNYGIIILGIFLVSGVIMYAKFKYSSQFQ